MCRWVDANFARPSAVDELGDFESIKTENFLTDEQ
jgi:hypothetical protein